MQSHCFDEVGAVAQEPLRSYYLGLLILPNGTADEIEGCFHRSLDVARKESERKTAWQEPADFSGKLQRAQIDTE